MFITKMYMPRRTFLRGLGATIALPLLDGMIPALSALGATAAKPIRRLGVVYVPNGMMMQKWSPAAEGPLALSPIQAPLAPFKDKVLVVSGLNSLVADALPGEGGGAHSRAQASFLTGVHPKKTEGTDFQAGVSVDQIAAKELGQQTQLASLELALENTAELVGACDIGYSCAYSGTIAWRGPTTPLPMEIDPRAAFERLFGDSTDPKVRLARIQKERSILDAATHDVARLQRGLGARDVSKLNEYLEAVRDVERRIQKAEDQNNQELPAVEQPVGIPPTFEEHAKLMFDLLALAYQTDLTRISTFMMARELSYRAYPEVGVNEAHHPVSHHANNPAQLEKLSKINLFHMKQFAYFVEKLQSTPDGDGSLLDHSMIVYGASFSNSNEHYPHDLPIMVVGGGAGQLKGGRHLRFEANVTPLANLHLTLLDKMGMNVERFGDSSGKLELLSGV